MTQNENESLVALERLMEEFFSSSTTNLRKHEIETQLNSFSAQRDSWKLCIYFIQNTASQFVSIYALSTIDSVINRQWNCLEWEHRMQLRNALQGYLSEQDATTPHYIRNKLAKLIVDIARYDWPHVYPEFFTNITQLLQSEHGRLLGLVLLRTTSEELMSPRPDLSSYRKDELTRLLQQHIPQVFQILTSILNGLDSKRRHNATATPPPSPTHPSSAPSLAEQLSQASFRPDNKAITREVLATLQHLFTWANLAQIPVQIIQTIFNFTNVSSYAQDDDDMCVLAMSTLNELLYRKCVPPGSQDLFIQLYHYTVQLLRDLTNPTSSKIDTLGPDFMEKLSELLALLVEQHLWRLESEPGFSALEFLGLLFQLTVQLPSIPCYLRCLAVWSAFIKQIKPQNVQKYSEALHGLIIAVLNKMQFVCNAAQLNDLSNEELNDNNETEWQFFLKTSIELIAIIAEFAPMETFTRVLAPWKSCSDVYCMLENAVDARNCTLKLDYCEIQRLHYILRDFSSLTQTLARLSTHFIDQGNEINSEHFSQAAPLIDTLFMKLMQSASLATTARFYHLKLNDSKLISDFTDVHSQLLAAMKTWWLWININPNFKCKDVNELTDLILPILLTADREPSSVAHGASHLLLSLTTSIHPPNLVTQPKMLDFLQNVPNIKFGTKDCKEVVLCALVSLLIKPWGELTQIDSSKRNQMVFQFFDGITSAFKELNESTDENRINAVVGDLFPCLCSIIDYAKTFPLASKKLLYLALKATIDHSLCLLSPYSKYSEANEQLLTFFLNVLSVLQQQMGVITIKQAVETFLSIAIRKHISALDKLLQILQLVIEASGTSYKAFLPGILNLCMENVFPMVIGQANEHPDTLIALINLLHSILLHRWSYFYVSQIRLGNSPGCSDAEPCPDSPQQPEQLLALLQVFGQSLLQIDINIFRTSLGALENLNTKWKLYHKALFRDHLLSQFLTVLLKTLLDESHNLLTDDIILALYNMAAVSFQYFFYTFLPHFLDGVDGVMAEQKHTLRAHFTQETDMPTFVLHLQRFVNDVRCARLNNLS